MNVRTVLSTGTLGIGGLVAAGLLALPAASSSNAAADMQYLKRDEDTPDLVLVADDDDDDTNANTNTNTNNTNTQSKTNDNTGTGSKTGRDKSRAKKVKDFTKDGPGTNTRDRSARSTNDRSRNNTRR